MQVSSQPLREEMYVSGWAINHNNVAPGWYALLLLITCLSNMTGASKQKANRQQTEKNCQCDVSVTRNHITPIAFLAVARFELHQFVISAPRS